MLEESKDTLLPEKANAEGVRHEEALAEAFAASLADPAPVQPPMSAEAPAPTADGANPAIGGDMPTILLIQAGLTVFNAVIILIYLVFWMIDITIIANALRVGAGFALLLSLAPAFIGAFLVRRYTKQKIKPPGAIWAHAGVYVGVAMCTLTMVIPMIVTLRSIFGAT